MRTHFSGFATALLALASPAAASTWTIDDDGGPGVDFTSITAALAASTTGDVLIVRPGDYAGFTLSIGVSILTDSAATITTGVRIENVIAGPRATLAGFTIPWLALRNCQAPVTLESLVLTGFGLTDAGRITTVEGRYVQRRAFASVRCSRHQRRRWRAECTALSRLDDDELARGSAAVELHR